MTEIQFKREDRERLIERAKMAGVCTEGIRHLVDDGFAALVEYHKSIPEWGIETGIPGMEILRKYKSDIEEFGIYVDRVFRGERIAGPQTVMLHKCKGEIEVGIDMKMRVIPMLYLCDGSMIKIRVVDGVRVPVYVSSDSNVEVKRESDGSCRIYSIEVKGEE